MNNEKLPPRIKHLWQEKKEAMKFGKRSQLERIDNELKKKLEILMRIQKQGGKRFDK